MGELYRIKSVIEELYSEKGYRFAQANFAIEPAADGEQQVVFTIDEGDRVRIGDIRFEGNTVFRDVRLRWEMKNTKESGLITRMFKKDIYNPASLSEDLDKVRDVYREAGYKNVVIGEPQIQVRVENPKAAAEEQKRRLVITIPVEEGNRWKFGNVSIEGNEIFPEKPLLSVVQVPPGLLAERRHRPGRRRRDQGGLQQHGLHQRPGDLGAGRAHRRDRRRGHPRRRGGPVPGRPDRVRGQHPDQGQGAAPRVPGPGGPGAVARRAQEQPLQDPPARLLRARRRGSGRVQLPRRGHGRPDGQGARGGPDRAPVRRRLQRGPGLLRPALAAHPELPRPRRAGGGQPPVAAR